MKITCPLTGEVFEFTKSPVDLNWTEQERAEMWESAVADQHRRDQEWSWLAGQIVGCEISFPMPGRG